MAPKSSQRNGVECHGINGSSMPWGKGRGCRSSSSSRTKHDLLILVASVSVLSEIRQNLQIHCGGLRRRHCFLHQTCWANDFPLRCSTWLKVAWSNAPSRFEKHWWSCGLEAYIDVGVCNIQCNLLPNGMHFTPVADPKQPWPWDISTWKPSAPKKYGSMSINTRKDTRFVFAIISNGKTMWFRWTLHQHPELGWDSNREIPGRARTGREA